MARIRAGLHKEISTIFDGVPLPRSGQVKQASHRPPPGRIGYVPAKTPDTQPAAPEPQPAAPRQAPKTDTSLRTARRTSQKWSTRELFKPKAGISSARQKVAVLLIPVLLILLVVVLVHNSGITWQWGAEQQKPPPPKQTVARSGVAIGWEFQPAYSGGLDPMARSIVDPKVEEQTGGKLVLTGIVIAKDRSYAIINGNIVEEGEQEPVSGATVRRISPNCVEVETDGRIVRLYVQVQQDSK
ncbi:MAG TPA: hypothetical protein VMX13_17860 [Sedimentisphaerales bacterium]|nr:hypothetical protein [Sedimentisphaerales bacterium]